MFEIIPLKFSEKEKDNFECDSAFGLFKFWKTTSDKKEIWKIRSLDKKTKRFYIDIKKSKEKAEEACQKDYKSIFNGLIKEI